MSQVLFNVAKAFARLLDKLGDARLCAGWVLFVLEALDTAWPEAKTAEFLRAVQEGIGHRLEEGIW
ncbi:MAG: hypothetical protein DRI61_06275 [Chloroflexi bacterium]|nr:MAG: hypothetical protein DRI61_06275 [Chloroflexota bacterium]HDN79194.1 hypothetical protein [Chloroflexota bacterium]